MNREDAEKLLGGYAAGNLTPPERDALFAAALEDQQLFDALVCEEPLRELLQDAAARRQLLANLEQAPEPWYYRPLSPAAIAASAAALIAFALVVSWRPLPLRKPVTPVEPQIVTVRPEVKPFSALPDSLRPQPVPSPVPRELPPPPLLPSAAANPPLPLLAQTPAPPGPPAPNPRPVLGQSFIPSSSTVQPPLPNLSVTRTAAEIPLLGLPHAILRKLPGGGLAEVNPQQVLDRDDEVVIRLQVSQVGYLYLMEKDAQNQWQPFATQRVLRPGSYTLPSAGGIRADSADSKDLYVLFSRVPLTNATRGLVPVAMPITLRYK
jgi:hypothetical protein